MARCWQIIGIAALLLALVAPVRGQGVLFETDFEGDRGRPGQFRIIGAIGDDYWMARDGAFDTGDGNTFMLGATWAFLDVSGSSAWRDVRATTNARMQDSAGTLGLAVRWESSQRFYAAMISVTSSQTEVAIERHFDGTRTVLASMRSPGDAALPRLGTAQGQTGPVRISFQAVGDQLSLAIDGTTILTATDSRIPAGSAALGQSFNRVLFDDFRIEAASAAAVAGDFVLELATGLSRGEADAMAARVASLPRVVVREEGGGRFAVYAGNYPSRGAADTARAMVAQQFDIDAQRVIPASAMAGRDPAPAPGTGYRAVVARSLGDEEARRLRADLNVDGFTPNETLSGPQGRLVVAGGPFATSAEARNLVDRLQATGFVTAEVMSASAIEAAIGSTPAATPAPVVATPAPAAATPAPTPAPVAPPAAVAELPLPTPSPQRGGGLPLVPIVIGVVVLAAAGGGAFVFLRGRSAAPAPAAKPSTGLSKPGGSLTKLGSAPAAAKKAAAKPAPGKPAAAKAPMKPVGDDARIKPGSFAPAPEDAPAAEPAPPPAKESSDGIKLDFGEAPGPAAAIAESAIDRILQGAPSDKTGEEPTVGDLSLDFLVGEEPAPSTEAPPPAPSSAAVPVNTDYYFRQDFEDEAPGARPANWNGEYEYADLVVQAGNTRDGSRNCVRFEKKEGVGSAYYSARFPDARGRVGIEFDIRCDDKNKYLLGFYIEKDGDFRQSISTVVHRTNSRAEPTLRIQNEPAPYEFGTWRHVRMQLDLTRAVLDVELDGEPMMTGHRIANCPKVVNTLSIRDNLATTGVLLMDDIKIYPLGG